MKKRVAIALAILSVAGICFFTLRTGGTTITRTWSWYLTAGDAALAELIQNLILFIPFGAFLYLSFPLSLRERGSGGEDRTRRHAYLTVGIGALLSFCIEFAQQYIPGRDPSVGDIVANTISTALGVLAVVSARDWLWTPPRRSSWQALATAVIAVSAWFLTGVMVRHDTPPLPYHIVETPDFNFFGHYRGKVIDIRPGLGLLQVTAIAAPHPPGRTSPLVAILDHEDRRIIMLSVDGPDLTLRYSMPAVRWTLEQPDLRLRNALHDVAPRDTFTAATSHDSGNVCLRLNQTERCHLGYTIGDGWKLIYYPERRAPWITDIVNTLWMAGCVIGIGFWGARGRRGEAAANKGGGDKDGGEGRRPRGAALALVIAGLLMVPLITGLKPTPVNEWIGALGGLGVGYWIGNRALKRRLGNDTRP